MNDEALKKQKFKQVCGKEHDGILLVDFVTQNSNLSKSLIKKLMVNGSVFQTFANGKRRHVRKARNTIKTGDCIECFYDPSIDLEIDYQFSRLLETANFGIYHKPAGAPTEGNNYGDKTSLIRFVEKLKRYVFLVNRLDKETEGLVVVAYNSKSQNLLQQIWRDGVTKKYQAIVLGEMKGAGSFDLDINKKFSQTNYRCVKSVENQTYVEIEPTTERKNQIRIHLSDAGHPVIGDPIFGQHNKNKEGLQLISYSLEFKDPHNKKQIKVDIPEDRLLF